MTATRHLDTKERGQRSGFPLVAIVGRPNVGKSTLVNRIVGRRIAIVEERPGVTRDRLVLRAEWRGREFDIVDTGGVVERGDLLDRKVSEQALRAVRQATVVCFLVDATTGPTAEDEALVRLLRRQSAHTILVANKVDSAAREVQAFELLRLGFGDPVSVSALHGRGIGDLLDVVVANFEDAVAPDEEAIEDNEEKELAAVAIVGRPNVGKSTLFNRLVGEDRSVVDASPGTTRDAVDTVVKTDEGTIRFIDTAGLRRRARTGEASEYYSLVRSLAAIDRADVALFVLDAEDGVTHQDQRLAERVDASGSPIVIVCNKWDLLSTEQRLAVANEIADRLGFLRYAPVLRVSAKTGLGLRRVLPALRTAIDAYHRRISTAELNDAMKQIQSGHPAPGARILYAVQGATDPPTITLFCTGRLQPTYLRYVENSLRQRFALGPTPLKLRVRLRSRR